MKSDHKIRQQLQSEKDDIVTFDKYESLLKIWQSEQSKTRKPKAWLAKASNASREELRFDRKASEVASSTVVMSMLDLLVQYRDDTCGYSV